MFRAVVLETFGALIAVLALVSAIEWAARWFSRPAMMSIQRKNRERIEKEVDLTCATHGKISEDDALLIDGNSVCPHCYRAARLREETGR